MHASCWRCLKRKLVDHAPQALAPPPPRHGLPCAAATRQRVRRRTALPGGRDHAGHCLWTGLHGAAGPANPRGRRAAARLQANPPRCRERGPLRDLAAWPKLWRPDAARRAQGATSRLAWSRALVYAVLRRNNPAAHFARCEWAGRRIAREPYYAPHFGYSFHIDLACKIQEYRLYVFAGLDGCTRRVLHLRALTDKLPTTVYEKCCLPIFHEHGMPDQLVSDKGFEFRICSYVCFMLASVFAHRRSSTRAPHRCVPSKRNVRHPPRCTAVTHRPCPCTEPLPPCRPSWSASTTRSTCASSSTSVG